MITRPSQAERRLGCVEPVHGILSLDKPLGFSSMKAVAIVRRRAGGTRTGHAGTLDPLATGVLVLALGVREWALIHFPEGVAACSAQGECHWQPAVRMPATEIVGTAGAGDALQPHGERQ